MSKKINAKNVATLAASTTLLSATFGIVGSYVLSKMYPHNQIDTGFLTGLSWMTFHTPVIFAATDSLRHELGLKSPVFIKGISARGSGRKITVNYGNDGNKAKDIFLSVLPIDVKDTAEELTAITVTMDETDYTILLSEIEDFIRIAWGKQRQGKSGLSRNYWTKTHRPRMKTLDYNIMIFALQPIIVDRKKGKSGKLLDSPLIAIERVKNLYQPA
jgi:hypothetical protein